MRGRRLTAGVIALCSVPSLAQPVHEREGPHEERSHDHRVPMGSARSPAGLVVLNEFTSIQVNLDEQGLNIVGDAANEPSIAVDPTAPNRLVVGWRQFDSIQSNFRQAGFSQSLDGGRTWAPMGVIEPGVFRTDPVVRADGDGFLYYLSLTITDQNEYFTDLFISADGGSTWPIKSFAFGGDKQWFTIDPALARPHLYQGWQRFENLWRPNQFNRSSTAGMEWEIPIDYDPDGASRPDLGTLAVGPDGAVHVIGRLRSGNILGHARSDDAQDPLVPVPTFEISALTLREGIYRACICGSPVNPAGMLGQPQVVVDTSAGPSRGSVYVLAGATSEFAGEQATDLVLRRSTDRGQTWSEPIQVVPDVQSRTYRWFGTISIAPNGRLDVVYNDTVNSPDDSSISETYYTSSTDAGDTWSTPVPLSPQWNSHVGWPNQNKIGDYYDLVSDDVGAHLIYAATFNGEQDVYYLRIGDYDCNANGVGDLIDIARGDALDCNANEIPDSCEIATGLASDSDGDGIIDACECPADLDADSDADSDDFFLFLDLFASGDSTADLDRDGDHDGEDFAQYLELFARKC